MATEFTSEQLEVMQSLLQGGKKTKLKNGQRILISIPGIDRCHSHIRLEGRDQDSVTISLDRTNPTRIGRNGSVLVISGKYPVFIRPVEIGVNASTLFMSAERDIIFTLEK